MVGDPGEPVISRDIQGREQWAGDFGDFCGVFQLLINDENGVVWGLVVWSPGISSFVFGDFWWFLGFVICEVGGWDTTSADRAMFSWRASYVKLWVMKIWLTSWEICLWRVQVWHTQSNFLWCVRCDFLLVHPEKKTEDTWIIFRDQFTRWWFQICLFSSGSFLFWLIFFKRVETTK